MFDSEHGHLAHFIVDAVQHSIGPTPSAVKAGAQRTTDSAWILDQGASDEIDHSCADRLRKFARRWPVPEPHTTDRTTCVRCTGLSSHDVYRK